MITEEHDGDSTPYGALDSRDHHRPGRSLIASAKRLTGTNIGKAAGRDSSGQSWQEDAWAMYDLVGEQHFLATTLANRVGAARLFVGRLADDPTDDPEPVEDGPVAEAFASFGGSHGTQAQMVARLALNLFIAGDGWLVGIPRQLLPDSHDDRTAADTEEGIGPAPADFGPNGEILLALSDLEWRMLSVSEVAFKSRQVQLKLGDNKDDQVEAAVDDLFLVRVWRPHPRKWWEADSPTRASLPVLRELVGLTEHVSAQVDSRLAGAGVFIVPSSARDALLQRVGQPEDDEDDSDLFTEALMESMTTPIKDRSNASAYVPLVVTVPDDAAEKFRHISFASQLDAEARNLREEAIRRLALGQDCPPEVLLGLGDANHWSAWLVREDTITTHIEPPLALICDALTTQFLRPVLVQQGMDAADAEAYVVWFDVSDMIMRPNRAADAATLYAAGAISAEAYRDATGFGDADAPAVAAEADPAVALAVDLVKGAPSLAKDPGLPMLVDQIRQVLSGTPADDQPVEDTEDTPASDAGPGPVSEPGPPPQNGADPEPVAAAGSELVARFDGRRIDWGHGVRV